MTLRREFEVVETPQGIGEVRSKGEFVARVSYDLRVEMVDVFARSFQGEETCVAGHKLVTGEISLLEGEIALPSGASPPSR